MTLGETLTKLGFRGSIEAVREIKAALANISSSIVFELSAKPGGFSAATCHPLKRDGLINVVLKNGEGSKMATLVLDDKGGRLSRFQGASFYEALVGALIHGLHVSLIAN